MRRNLTGCQPEAGGAADVTVTPIFPPGSCVSSHTGYLKSAAKNVQALVTGDR